MRPRARGATLKRSALKNAKTQLRARVSKRRRCARYGPTSRLTAARHRSGRDLAAERAEIAGPAAENDATAAPNISASNTAGARTHKTQLPRRSAQK